jgi:predicted transcriptional regulator
MASKPSAQLNEWANAGGEQQVPVRHILELWGAKRRSFQVVDQINRDLRRHGLRASPSIIDVPIDDEIALTSVGLTVVPPQKETSTADPNLSTTEPVAASSAAMSDLPVRMKVSWVPSANWPVERVAPDADLTLAQAKMLRHDYSQLAVQGGDRSRVEAISWESIAKARMVNPSATIRDAVSSAACVDWNDDLLPLIPTIIERGYVFVHGQDRKLSGIVTTADLSKQFEEFANPFLMLGEIERGLRVVIDDAFSTDVLKAIRDGQDSNRTVESAADLTVGEMLRLLQVPANFEQLGWIMDRGEFISAMEEIRALRNEVMHFSPDAVGPDELRTLRNFQQMLQKLAPQL